MHISEYLCSACTIAELRGQTKTEVLRELADTVSQAHVDKDAAYAALLERERLGTTAVGKGCAIPHGKLAGLKTMILTFARSVPGVDFGAPDGGLCHFFFMVLAPEGAAGQHLGLLGSISRLAEDAAFTSRLMQAKTAKELEAFLAGA